MQLSYPTILIVLGLSVTAFIGGLIWFRTKRNGDYTVIKVIAGVALVIAAQYLIIEAVGLPQTRADVHRLLLVPFAVGGGAITLWQAIEWCARRWELLQARIDEAVRKATRGQR